MKLVVQTTGSFVILAASAGVFVQADRPAVVEKSAFINTHMAGGRLEMVAQVADEATDAELQALIKENGVDLGLASFLSIYGPEATPAPVRAPEPAPAPKPAPKKGGRR